MKTRAIELKDKIIADYTAAGWAVQYGDDQRDGAYPRFT